VWPMAHTSLDRDATLRDMVLFMLSAAASYGLTALFAQRLGPRRPD
jgi:hypothetical protein